MIRTHITSERYKVQFGRTDRMNKEKFLLHVDYSRDCPDRIHPMRWKAMLTWAKKRGYIS